jgi:hypothetical protein
MVIDGNGFVDMDRDSFSHNCFSSNVLNEIVMTMDQLIPVLKP